ncbi:Chloroperoxidase [Phytophthora cactorum]|nr:Chloroperoxidase [Phytophthora cactorum]
MVSITASFAFVATAFGIAYGYTEAAAFSEGEYYHPPTLPDLAAVMGDLSPPLFDLNDLSKHHDQVEHDASLAHIDS